MTQMPTPVARRLQRPSWRDARLVVGVLLVLLAVLGTGRLVASADDTTPVYAATRHLLPGQQLAAADVVPVAVLLGADAGLYVDGTRALAPGTVMVREVRAGELVPTSALGDAADADGRTVTVPVDSSAAEGYAAGTVADVWVSHKDEEVGSTGYTEPVLLITAAGVQAVPVTQGGLGIAADRASVQLLVDADDVSRVIAAVDQDARITLVPVPGQDPGS